MSGNDSLNDKMAASLFRTTLLCCCQPLRPIDPLFLRTWLVFSRTKISSNNKNDWPFECCSIIAETSQQFAFLSRRSCNVTTCQMIAEICLWSTWLVAKLPFARSYPWQQTLKRKYHLTVDYIGRLVGIFTYSNWDKCREAAESKQTKWKGHLWLTFPPQTSLPFSHAGPILSMNREGIAKSILAMTLL